jgi:signal peptidase I
MRTRPAVLVAGAAALTLLVLRVGVVEPVRVNGISMVPTLETGQVTLVNKLDRDPSRGDLVTLRSPADGQKMLKRVVGVGGDVVDIRDAVLYVNDVEVSEPYVDHRSIDALYYGPVTVSPGAVLVMGDAREDSIDSRTYGEVPLADVTGTVLASLWPPGGISRG